MIMGENHLIHMNHLKYSPVIMFCRLLLDQKCDKCPEFVFCFWCLSLASYLTMTKYLMLIEPEYLFSHRFLVKEGSIYWSWLYLILIPELLLGSSKKDWLFTLSMLYGLNDTEVIVQCGTSVDGSWKYCGMSSPFDLVLVISTTTDQILDSIVLRNLCCLCAKWENADKVLFSL